MRKALRKAVQGFALGRRRRRIFAFDRQRILSMIDAGCAHANIEQELGFSGAEIDRVLRQHMDADR